MNLSVHKGTVVDFFFFFKYICNCVDVFFLFSFLSSWYFLIVSTAEVSFTKQTMLSLSKCKQKCTDALSYCQS